MNKLLVLALAILFIGLVLAATSEKKSENNNEEHEENSHHEEHNQHHDAENEHHFRIRKNLSSKTEYFPQGDLDNATPPPEGCRLKHIQFIARHSARYVSSDDFTNLIDFLANLQTHLSELKNEWHFLSEFRPDLFDIRYGGHDTKYGLKSFYDLAKRVLEANREVLNSSYDQFKFYFQSMMKDRVIQSAQMFGYSVFENKGSPLIHEKFAPIILFEHENPDTICNPTDFCPNFPEEPVNPELTSFFDQNFQHMADKLKAKLFKVGSTITITKEDVLNLFNLCLTEIAALNTSTTCTMFDELDAENYVYYSDLEKYYTYGYGGVVNGIGYKSTSELLKTLLIRFGKYDSNLFTKSLKNVGDNAELYFMSDSTILGLQTLLGLYKDDEPLTANNLNPARKYKTTLMIPFASNMLFQLYECPVPNSNPNYYVNFFVNEKQTEIPLCAGNNVNNFYCPLNVFYNSYKNLISTSDYNYNTICSTDYKLLSF